MDKGPGQAKGQINHLFARFAQTHGMKEFRVPQLTGVLFLCALCLVLARPAWSNCILTPEVGRLVEAMEVAVGRPTTLDGSDAADLYRRAQRVHLTDVANRLRDAGYPANTHAVDKLIEEARNVAQRRMVTSHNVTRMRIRRVEKLRERVCAAEARMEMAGHAENAPGATGGQDSGDGPFQRNGGAGSVALRLSMVPVTLASVVGASYMAKLAYIWIFALLFNRRKCWVPARLKIGVDVIPGHLSILGRKGARFQPDSRELSARMEAQAPCIDAKLLVAGLSLDTRLEDVIDGFGIVYFNALLGPGKQKALLASSRIEPKLVPKTSPKPSKGRAKRPAKARKQPGKVAQVK